MFLPQRWISYKRYGCVFVFTVAGGDSAWHVASGGIGADFEETIQAQQSLFACGVDDVILNSSHKSELKLSVGLSLGRRREQQRPGPSRLLASAAGTSEF